MALAVAIETGSRRAFACALDLPGWCRSGRDEQSALEALEASRERYAQAAGVRPRGAFEIVERVAGDATTDFGAPGAILERDHEPVTAAQARRHVAIMEAAWQALAEVVVGAPAELRKGPRGGGRDRDAVDRHVREAEDAYARKIGVRVRGDDAAAVAQRRALMLDVLGASSPGGPLRERGWPARYAVRRIVWHVLDHAWEIEDRIPQA